MLLHETTPKTLLELAGVRLEAPSLADAALVLIDYQNEYVSGALPLDGVDAAIGEASALLERARTADTPIVHIAHKGGAGGLFDREAERGAIVDALAPRDGETVIEKALPNAFAGTGLRDTLAATGHGSVIFAGFMTHMCLSSTVRAALDLGLSSTVVSRACASRSLPGTDGEIVPGGAVHQVALAELADRFALIVPDAGAFKG